MTEAAQSAAEPVARMRAIGLVFCRFAEQNPWSYRLITVVVQPVPASEHPPGRAIADCHAAGLAADVRSAGAEQQLVGWRVRAPGTTRNTPRAKF